MRLQKIIKLVFLSSFLFLYGCNENNKKFKFAFMTDIHVQPERNAEEGFQKAIESINNSNPDFVITGGDLVYDVLDESYGRADTLYNIYKNVQSKINAPVYNTIGNHEVFAIDAESDVSSDHPEYGKKMYKNRIGNNELYYSFDYNNWHFISLDGIGIKDSGEYFGYIDSLQMDWIKKDLSNVDRNTPIVLITHIPFVSVGLQMYFGPTAAFSDSEVVTNALDVLDIFKEHNLKLVLQGHLHIVEEIIYNDVHFITGGAVSGKWWQGPREGFEEGYVLIEVNGDDFSWEYVDYNWDVEDEEGDS